MSNLLNSLNPRERRLLLITILLLVTVVGSVIVYKGYDYIRVLNRQIANTEQEILNLYEQTLQSESVDAAFQQVVSEHSTEMSKEEIHDSLRREIYRLALKNPNIPESEQKGAEKDLVVIPMLREGVLREEGEGYREYQIRFRVPKCTLSTALEFLRRLEQSNQLLRIDSFEMSRSHSSSNISLTIEVTRTVLSDIEVKSPDDTLAEWNTAHALVNGRRLL